MLESAGIGIAFIKGRTVIRCNQRFAEIYGYAQIVQVLGLRDLMIKPTLRENETLNADETTNSCHGTRPVGLVDPGWMLVHSPRAGRTVQRFL